MAREEAEESMGTQREGRADLEPRARFVRSRGLDLELLEWPQLGDTEIFLVHGFLDNAWSWSPFVEGIAPGRTVRAITLAGHGASGWSPSYQWIDFVHDVRVAITDSCKKPVVLIAHSMGAHVASAVAYYFPELVSALVIIDGFSPQRHAPTDYTVMSWAEEVAAAITSQRQWGTRFPSFEAIFKRRQELFPRIPEMSLRPNVLHGTIEKHDGWTWSADSRLSSRYFPWESRFGRPIDVLSTWANIFRPILLLSGGIEEADYLTPNREVADIAERELPHVDHTKFADCGHYLHLEQFDRAITTVNEFLNRRLAS